MSHLINKIKGLFSIIVSTIIISSCGSGENPMLEYKNNFPLFNPKTFSVDDERILEEKEFWDERLLGTHMDYLDEEKNRFFLDSWIDYPNMKGYTIIIKYPCGFTSTFFQINEKNEVIGKFPLASNTTECEGLDESSSEMMNDSTIIVSHRFQPEGMELKETEHIIKFSKDGGVDESGSFLEQN